MRLKPAFGTLILRVYDTKKPIERAINKSGVPRKDIFLITKLWCNSYHPDDMEPALDAALADLNTECVELFLMYYPCTFQRGSESFPKGKDGCMIVGTTTFIDTWKAMGKLSKKGKVKAVGISNFSKGEVQELLNEGSITPAVHQMELHPYSQQKSFVEWQKSKDIHMMQPSPLGNQNSLYRDINWATGKGENTRFIDESILIEIVKNHGKIPAQVALAWGLANGRSVIPKSIIDWQMKENLESGFELDIKDLEKIGSMDRKLRFNDPSSAYEWELYSDLDGAWSNQVAT